MLNEWRRGRDETAAPTSTLRIPISSQLELGRRLAEVAMLDDAELPITPLLVRLYVERALHLLDKGRNLDELPGSIPEIYFDYLRQVNPKSVTAEHYLDETQMIRSCCALAKVMLARQVHPRIVQRLGRRGMPACRRAAGDSDPAAVRKRRAHCGDRRRGFGLPLP